MVLESKQAAISWAGPGTAPLGTTTVPLQEPSAATAKLRKLSWGLAPWAKLTIEIQAGAPAGATQGSIEWTAIAEPTGPLLGAAAKVGRPAARALSGMRNSATASAAAIAPHAPARRRGIRVDASLPNHLPNKPRAIATTPLSRIAEEVTPDRTPHG